MNRRTRTIRTEQHGQAGEWYVARRNYRHPETRAAIAGKNAWLAIAKTK